MPDIDKPGKQDADMRDCARQRAAAAETSR
jgi:hypothetical protein